MPPLVGRIEIAFEKGGSTTKLEGREFINFLFSECNQTHLYTYSHKAKEITREEVSDI